MKVHREIQLIINYNFFMIKCNYDNLFLSTSPLGFVNSSPTSIEFVTFFL